MTDNQNPRSLAGDAGAGNESTLDSADVITTVSNSGIRIDVAAVAEISKFWGAA